MYWIIALEDWVDEYFVYGPYTTIKGAMKMCTKVSEHPAIKSIKILQEVYSEQQEKQVL